MRYLNPFFLSKASSNVRPSSRAASSIRSRLAPVIFSSSSFSNCWFCLTSMQRMTVKVKYSINNVIMGDVRAWLTKCQNGGESERGYANKHGLVVVGSPFGFPSVGSDPITAYMMLGCKLRVLGMTDRFPKFPKPLTIPMAADRLAGGLGTALETHTRVRANPVERNFRHVQGWQL